MRRRTLLGSLVAAGATLASVWARRASAGGAGFGLGCGAAAHDVEEEFLDLRVADAGKAEELSHFYTHRLDVPADERFHVADDGRVLAYLGNRSFHLRAGNAAAHEVSAPNGGKIVSSSTSYALALKLYTLSPYDQVVVANPKTGAHEIWDDAYGPAHLVSSPWGFVLAHRDTRDNGGCLSLLTGERRTRELARTESVPTHVCTAGSRIGYFLDERAFVIDLTKPDEAPEPVGRLPKPATLATFSGSNLVATTGDGAWLFGGAHAPRRIVAMKNPGFLFARREKIVVASARCAVIDQSGRNHTVDAPNGNLHFIAPIDGSDDLILCRGRSVLRYRARTRRLETIGRGRDGMKLRGAALARDRLLTWSSRTWRLVDGDCRAVQPPRAYLID